MQQAEKMMNRSYLKTKANKVLLKTTYFSLGDKLYHFFGFAKSDAESYVRSIKQSLLSEACIEFEKKTSPGDLDNYKLDLEKHWVSHSEYAYQYKFYNKTEEEKDGYVSRAKMRYFYKKHSPRVVIPLFAQKQNFFKVFYHYIHRKWLYAPVASFDEFVQLLTCYDCIIKPYSGSLGKGIFKIYKDADHKNDRKLYEFCVKNKMIVEQCIESCEELKAFHPQSLNTIRVVTVSNRKKAEVFGGVLRTGIGNSVIDNVHAGGVYAHINITNGLVEGDGMDANGKKYEYHPDGGIKFNGFQIPKWNTIIETCCEAAKLTKNMVTGWDVVINSQGEVEFIEGNCWPDFDIMQSPKTGAKMRLNALLKKYYGIEI